MKVLKRFSYLTISGSLLFFLLGSAMLILADEDNSLPHKGNPPLHAQDKMRAFKDDHHAPQDLSALSFVPCTGGSASGYPCRNVDLMAFLPLSQIGGGNGNDIWGWTDPVTGKEYAIMGRTSGTSFVDISDPENPVYLGNLPPHASNSTWRDIKVYADHAFMVSEAIQSGMQVFDLTQLRNVTSPPVTFAETAWYNGFLTAHNLVINEDSGYAYAVGSNTCSGGLHMVHISNPTSPTFAGCFGSDGYTHDAQCVIYDGPDISHVGKEICLNSNEDTLTIVDVTNKSNPVMLSRTGYAGARYTHQGWLTEDHVYFLIDDEMDETQNGHNTRTYMWNVSNLDAPVLIGNHTAATAAIDHNQYIKGNYTYQANYRAGLRILDISDIAGANLSEVAYFDIYPSSDSPSYNGAWSNYPFFNSGIVVVSGIEQGLYILRPNLSSGTAPAVSIFSPADGSTVGGTVTIQIDAADAEDPAGSLTVEWNVDGGAWQQAAYNATNGLYEASWDTTSSSNGTVTINARATDSTALQGSDSNTVTVSNPASAFHVGSIQVIAVRVSGPRYRAVATVFIVDEGASPVSGVSVSGTFTGDWSGSDTAITDSNGEAIFQTPPVKNGSIWTFCVDSASKTGWIYDAAANAETCDSTGGGPTAFGSVAGVVTDNATAQPISGANVSTDSGQNGTTDGAGNYNISSVPTGNRTVTATASGYESQQKQTTVSDGATSIVDFALNASTSGGSGTVKGTVTSTGGAKLAGVLVESDTGQSAITNKGGKYTMQNVPEGDRTITASAQGYITQQQSIALTAGQTVTVDFALSPE